MGLKHAGHEAEGPLDSQCSRQTSQGPCVLVFSLHTQVLVGLRARGLRNSPTHLTEGAAFGAQGFAEKGAGQLFPSLERTVEAGTTPRVRF